MEDKIRSFPDKRSLKEYTSTKPALQEMLKGMLQEKEEKNEREEQSYEESNSAMHKYLSIITLNVNGLNFPTKRHTVAE